MGPMPKPLLTEEVGIEEALLYAMIGFVQPVSVPQSGFLGLCFVPM